MPNGFVDIIIGAVIAGFVGLVAVWAQQRLQRQQYVRDKILAPTYDFIVNVTEKAHEWPGHDPWPKVAWSERRKVSPRLRRTIKGFSDAWEDYRLADVTYSNRVSGQRGDLTQRLGAGLSNHLDSQGKLPLGPFGETGGRALDLDGLFDFIKTPIIRHLDDPSAAWAEIETDRRSEQEGIARVFRMFREKHPSTLGRIHSELKSSPIMEEARDLLKEADERHDLALEKARELRRLLERKL